ncbi:MAG: SecD/SecF family protein translocase subunit [Clostridiales bacterium]|nr:MAG: SecD/SecF family protein translocase subunit [Clostridiales bacterium]
MLVLGMVFAFVPTFPIGKSMYDYTGYARSIKLGLDLAGGVSAVFDVKAPDGETLTTDELKTRLDGVKASMEDLLTSKGYTESVVTYNTTGNPTITVEIPDVDDPERVFDLIGRPASLKNHEKKTTKKTVYIVGSKHLKKTLALQPIPKKNNGTYVISLQFNAEGTKAFAAATKENIGKALDIYINGEKLMTVSVSSEISNGQAVIKQGGNSTTGGYTYEEAYNMATRLQAGTFGVDMTVRETNIVSPTLGTTAIRSSLIAGIVGIVLVMIFMVALYGMFGLMADMALLAYIELVLFLCSVLPWVQLTLPGIAGIIIGIGMAVDANIIIFERIKDEYRSGLLGSDNLFLKPQRGSDGKITSQGGPISRGFRRAAVAVIDSNVTTLIGAIVMWIFGGTSIVGFAVTLFISILVSMFTALLVTRLNISLFGRVR